MSVVSGGRTKIGLVLAQRFAARSTTGRRPAELDVGVAAIGTARSAYAPMSQSWSIPAGLVTPSSSGKQSIFMDLLGLAVDAEGERWLFAGLSAAVPSVGLVGSGRAPT